MRITQMDLTNSFAYKWNWNLKWNGPKSQVLFTFIFSYHFGTEKNGPAYFFGFPNFQFHIFLHVHTSFLQWMCQVDGSQLIRFPYDAWFKKDGTLCASSVMLTGQIIGRSNRTNCLVTETVTFLNRPVYKYRIRLSQQIWFRLICSILWMQPQNYHLKQMVCYFNVTKKHRNILKVLSRSWFVKHYNL